MGRRWAVVAIVLGSVVAVPLTVAAITLHNGSPVDRQRSAVKSSSSTTSSTSWAPVPGLRSTLVCAKGAVSATLSVNVVNAPVEFHLRIDNGGLMQPEGVHFDPTGGTRSFSYTFVARVGTFEGSDGHSFDLEWRSPGGAAVTLKHANLNLLFNQGSC